MEKIVAISTLVQAATTIVIAVATIVYTRATMRIFQSGIEPIVNLEIHGTESENGITIYNESGCSLREFTVSISVGCMQDNQKSFIRKCIFTHTWKKIAPNSKIKTRGNSIFDTKDLTDAGPGIKGLSTDTEDLTIDYSFMRSSDLRKYSFRTRVGFLLHSDGRRTYTRIEDPVPIATLRAHVLEPINQKNR